MSAKLYSRVSNFDDLEPLTGGHEEPFNAVKVSPSTSRTSGACTVKRCLVGTVIALIALPALAIILGVAVPIALGESQGAGPRDKCALDPSERFSCLPGLTAINQTLCLSYDCCWQVKSGSPSCFYSTKSGYTVITTQTTTLGQVVRLARPITHPGSPYGVDVSQIVANFTYETNSRLRIKMTDATKARYEVPLSTPVPRAKASDPQYTVTIQKEPVFGFTISRKDTGAELFKLAPGLVYTDQFLQLSTYLPSDNVYGIGEHAKSGLRLDTNHTTYTLFASDIGTNPDDPSRNLYGVHPFYMCLETTGHAHGVFMLNSNAMDVYLSPKPSLTWRAIGGVIDLLLFTGPSPETVVQQFTEFIGRPLLPPYWTLGFHLCRWGYNSANNTRDVVERMRELEIPQDVQWNDIDYMDSKLVFTYDTDQFKELPDLVTDLHEHGQKYIIIVDPGISNTQHNYPPYDNGLRDNLFIKDSFGVPIVGKVWPNDTVYPDFTHPNATGYWTELIRDFHSVIAFDGLWIDMNEPSNFGAGSISGCQGNSILDNPPFVPNSIVHQSDGILTKTLCMSAVQNLSTHYNLHSLYGHTEAVVTRRSLDAVLSVRSLLISRSTYSGSGAHTGHWLGDNTSQWKHLRASIPGILDFALFGIPMVGADICGFFGNTTDDLCTRWQQLGAFYPFSRNHNTYNTIAQDPTVWSNASIDAIREALNQRYSLLPYLYTLFYRANVNGSTVARPLFFEWPLDNETWGLDTQFLWGSAILISPVLTEGAVTVDVYFPQERWFDLRNGSEVKGGGHMTLDAPPSIIPLHVRGGAVLPLQGPGLTTTQSRTNPFTLLVAMDTTLKAEGDLYLDDGESLDTMATDKYSLVKFTANQDGLSGRVICDGYQSVCVERVTVYGLPNAPTNVTVNNITTTFDWESANKVLSIHTNSTVTEPLTVTWTL